MESPQQRCVRLVAALEDLADQESACVRCGDFGTIVDLQTRAAPIVAHLVENGPRVADVALRQRISAVIKLREQTTGAIQARLDETRQQLDSLQVSQRRVARVAPVYGRNVTPRSQLTVLG